MKSKRNKLVKSNYSDIEYWAKLYTESMEKINEEVINSIQTDDLIESAFSTLLHFLNNDGDTVLRDPTWLNYLIDDYETAIAKGLYKPEPKYKQLFNNFKNKLIKN